MGDVALWQHAVEGPIIDPSVTLCRGSLLIKVTGFACHRLEGAHKRFKFNIMLILMSKEYFLLP